MSKTIQSFWDKHTVSLDRENYNTLFNDSKVSEKTGTIYVEKNDAFAISAYQKESKQSTGFAVKTMPIKPSQNFVDETVNEPGLVASVLINDEEGVRGMPYIMLGGQFTELDVAASYFNILALAEAGNIKLAKQILGNISYMIGHVHTLKATNRSYHQNLPALPLYTSMAFSIALKLNTEEEKRAFLNIHIKRGILEYERVWENESSISSIGLNIFPKNNIDENTLSFSIPNTSIVPVRLNMMLYKTEMDLYHLITAHTNNKSIEVDDKVYSATYWKEKAQKRLELIEQYFWDDEASAYWDYCLESKGNCNKNQSDFIYALWSNALSQDRAEQVLKNINFSASSKFGFKYDKNSSVVQAPEQIIFLFGLALYRQSNLLQAELKKWRAAIENGYDKTGELAFSYNYQTGKPIVMQQGKTFSWTLALYTLAEKFILK